MHLLCKHVPWSTVSPWQQAHVIWRTDHHRYPSEMSTKTAAISCLIHVGKKIFKNNWNKNIRGLPLIGGRNSWPWSHPGNMPTNVYWEHAEIKLHNLWTAAKRSTPSPSNGAHAHTAQPMILDEIILGNGFDGSVIQEGMKLVFFVMTDVQASLQRADWTVGGRGSFRYPKIWGYYTAPRSRSPLSLQEGY